MKRERLMGLLALVALSVTSGAQAALVIEVSSNGVPGQSRWVFSGSAEYTEYVPGGKFAGGTLDLIEEWKGDAGSDFVKAGAYNNFTTDLISGSVSLSVTPSGGSAVTGLIDGLHVDHDNSGDDFGVSLAGSDILLTPNALVSWFGEAVFAVDLANLNGGIFNFRDYSENQAEETYGNLPLILAVPEPASTMLLLSGLLGWVGTRIRRRRMTGAW